MCLPQTEASISTTVRVQIDIADSSGTDYVVRTPVAMRAATMKKTLLHAVITAVLTLSNASASVVLFSDSPDFQGFHVSDFDSAAVQQQVADDFAITAPQVLNGLQWWGRYSPTDGSIPVSDSFTVRIFNLPDECTFWGLSHSSRLASRRRLAAP